MELTLGRLCVAVRILPPAQPACCRGSRRSGPAGEAGFMRLIRLRRDRRHMAGLDARLRRDAGLEPACGGGGLAPRRLPFVLWTGLHR